MGALAGLAARVLGSLAGGGGRALATRVGLPAAVGVGAGLIPGLLGGDDGRPRRRRRRRVLTANDRADIAFIVATLGPSAGKSFAMIVAART